MTRPQIQEEAIEHLARLLQKKMQPDGLAIVMEADHYCMQWRGVKDMNSKMLKRRFSLCWSLLKEID